MERRWRDDGETYLKRKMSALCLVRLVCTTSHFEITAERLHLRHVLDAGREALGVGDGTRLAQLVHQREDMRVLGSQLFELLIASLAQERQLAVDELESCLHVALRALELLDLALTNHELTLQSP